MTSLEIQTIMIIAAKEIASSCILSPQNFFMAKLQMEVYLQDFYFFANSERTFGFTTSRHQQKN